MATRPNFTMLNGKSNDVVVNDDQLTALINNIDFWWNTIIIPVGTVCNILCLLVVSQKQNRSISCSVYMGALSVADMLVLITEAVHICVINSPVSMFHKYVCKLVSFGQCLSSQCGSMIILALLVERVIVVTKPLKAASLLTPKRALIITLILVVLLAMFNFPWILSATAGTSGQCAFVPEPVVTSIVYNSVTAFISGVLPLCGILIMNLIILCAIKSSKYSTKKQRSKKCGSHRKRIDTVSQKVDSKKISGPANSDNIEMSKSNVSGNGDSATDDVPAHSVSDADAVVRQRHQASDDLSARSVSDVDVRVSTKQHQASDDVPARSVSDVDVVVRQHQASDNVPAHSVSDVAAVAGQHQASDAVHARSVNDVDKRTKWKQQGKMSKREQQLTVMAMAMTLAFLLCVMPLYVARLMFVVLSWGNADVAAADKKVALMWGKMVLHNLYMLNSAINFFLYAMAGSKFRSDLITLLHLN